MICTCRYISKGAGNNILDTAAVYLVGMVREIGVGQQGVVLVDAKQSRNTQRRLRGGLSLGRGNDVGGILSHRVVSVDLREGEGGSEVVIVLYIVICRMSVSFPSTKLGYPTRGHRRGHC